MSGQDQGKDGRQSGHFNPSFTSHSNDKILTQQSMTPSQVEADDAKVDRSYGLGPMKNPWLGKYISNLYVFAFLLGNAALLPAAGTKSLSINLQSLKTQFNLGNEKATDMQVANSIGIALSSLIAGYIGSFHRTHIPIVVGIAAFVNGIALMMPSFLQFDKPYHINETAITDQMFIPFLCVHFPLAMSAPEPAPGPDMTAYGVLLISQAMSGFLLPLVTVLAPVYIDNNEPSKKKVSVYIGIYTFFVEMASIAGLSISGFLATNTVDFRETKLHTLDTRFVGAWWLPLLLFGACLSLLALAIIQFPKRLISKRRQKRALAEAALSFAIMNFETTSNATDNPGSSATVDKKEVKQVKGVEVLVAPVPEVRRQPDEGTSVQNLSSQMSFQEKRPSIADSIVYDSIAVPRQGFVHGVRDFPMQVYRIFKNPIFALIMIEAALLATPMKGSELFRPTYQMFEFSLGIETISTAMIPYAIASIIGIIAGAVICRKIQTLKGYSMMAFICFGLCSLIAPLYFALGCDNQKLYGYTGQYGVALPNMTSECGCNSIFALPTCGDDGNSYYSPCYAGCLAGDGFTFQNCTRQATLQHGQDAKSMMCDAGCMNKFIGYTVVLCVLTVLTQMTIVPRALLIIRVVEPRDRAFATSVFIFLYALFTIPGSKIFGKVFEEVGCLIHMGDVCALYDRQKIRYLMSGMELSSYIVLFLTTWVMFLIFKMLNRKVAWKAEEIQTNDNNGY